MKRRVVITGYGLLTPFGFGEEAAAQRLLAGEDAFRPIRRFDTANYRCKIAAESGFSGSLMELGLACAEQAMLMAGLSAPIDAAVLIGTAGDYDLINRFTRYGASAFDREEGMACVPARHADRIAKTFTTGRKAIGFGNACVASSFAIGYAFDLIQSGKENAALCGGYYLNNEEMFAKFDSAQSLSKDGKLRAFSPGRTGLLLGDGGCVFVLEERERALARGARIYGEIAGWGASGDAHHVVQPHPEGRGMALAMTRALARAGLSAGDIQYINAHGTGTVLNDSAETKGIKHAFGEWAANVPISSTKTMTGHILHGTGAVETAICLMALNRGFLPPTANFEFGDEACDLNYVPHRGVRAELGCLMNLNSSFGGHNTAIILTR